MLQRYNLKLLLRVFDMTDFPLFLTAVLVLALLSSSVLLEIFFGVSGRFCISCLGNAFQQFWYAKQATFVCYSSLFHLITVPLLSPLEILFDRETIE